ncbi:DUF4291 domain-containing protein [Streptomyces sp. NBC_00820]|uniref:DUF4291 family protein n=1 Tax=Streptomyces sp. NBC_00820 TaxID=2975842 RepID=UPI002ED61853|nr:DUF4291 domain-containing protein [Streptomyces sp. NBC_00820]
MAEPNYQIRALYADSAVTVYQAYGPEIGLPTAREGRFPAVWQRVRMTWVIKARSRPFPSVGSGRPLQGKGLSADPVLEAGSAEDPARRRVLCGSVVQSVSSPHSGSARLPCRAARVGRDGWVPSLATGWK